MTIPLALLISTAILKVLCNELDDTVLKSDRDIYNAITNSSFSLNEPIRKTVLRLELALDEIGERLKIGDDTGKTALQQIIKNGGLLLTTIGEVDQSLLIKKYRWSEDRCIEFKFNVQHISSIWQALEGGYGQPTTTIYVSGRNRSGGVQYMERIRSMYIIAHCLVQLSYIFSIKF